MISKCKKEKIRNYLREKGIFAYDCTWKGDKIIIQSQNITLATDIRAMIKTRFNMDSDIELAVKF